MFARTQRLTLRPGWPEDAAALTQAVAYEEVATKLSRLPWPYRLEDAEAWLTTPRGVTEACMLILAHEQAAPRLVGVISILPDGQEPALGYWLTPDAWGHGYATEAGRAMLAIGRHALGLKRLKSSYFLDNPASGHVLRKLGFRETGRTMQFSIARGQDAAAVVLERTLDKDHPAVCFAA